MRKQPPLQNIPLRTEEGHKLREAFLKDAPDLSAADYSGIERRVAAWAKPKRG